MNVHGLHYTVKELNCILSRSIFFFFKCNRSIIIICIVYYVVSSFIMSIWRNLVSILPGKINIRKEVKYVFCKMKKRNS